MAWVHQGKDSVVLMGQKALLKRVVAVAVVLT